MYRLAKELKQNPSDILDWRESEFYLWLAVSREVNKDDMLERSILTSFAVWKPGELPDILEDRKRPMTDEEVQEALDRAEKYKNLDYKETT